MTSKPDQTGASTDFSLVVGGPLYQLFLRTRVLRPPLDLLRRRMLGITLFAWLPLLLLTAVTGQALRGVAVPFLLDLDAHARFLVALPLLIAAEMVVHERVRPVVRQFVDRGIITPEQRPRFEDIIASAMRLRNSVTIEVLLLVFVFTAGHWLWRENLTLTVTTWYATPGQTGQQLTLPGHWYAFVSLPVFRFLLLRWYFRLVVWYVVLARVARLGLQLNPLHPDRAGGLGFLGGSVFAFVPVLLAHTVLLAGLIGNHIWHEGASLPDFKMEIAGIMAFLLLLVLTPLFFFVTRMAKAKRTVLREYGALAARCADDFRHKWMAGDEPAATSMIGSSDVQSMADMSHSFDVVREMRVVPCSRQNVVSLGVVTALPLLPLVLTMVPLEELIGRVLSIVG